MRPDPYKLAKARTYKLKHGILIPKSKLKNVNNIIDLSSNINSESISVDLDSFSEGNILYHLPRLMTLYILRGNTKFRFG